MFFYSGLLGREHPEIGEDAVDEEENAETDTEDGVPVFSEIFFHVFSLSVAEMRVRTALPHEKGMLSGRRSTQQKGFGPALTGR
jgi:hypothetical protein